MEWPASDTGRARASALERAWARNPEFVSRRIGNEVILLPIKQNMGDLESIFTLTEVGARIWEQLDGRRTVAELRDLIIAEFEVGSAEAETDLLEFLTKLQALDGVVAP